MRAAVCRRLAALLTAAALLLPAGCADSRGEGLSLRVCLGAESASYDPIYASLPGDRSVLAHLYENLMRLEADENGRLRAVPAAAKSVEMTAEGDGSVVYTFRLRERRWSDGREVRASDFVYAWRRLANPASGSDYAALLSCVRGYEEARSSGDMSLLAVEAKNDATLVVTLTGHAEFFLTQVCTDVATMPLRQDVVRRLKQAAEDQAAALWCQDPTELVTNGPYTAVSVSPGAELTLRAAEETYARAAGPAEIVFRLAGPEDAWALYEAGELDLICPLPDAQTERLRDRDPDWQAEAALSTQCVLFNCAALLEPSLRRALSLSLDRAALAAAAGGTALPAEGLVPPCVPGESASFREEGGALLVTDEEGYAQRCQEALALLEESGFDQGGDLQTLEYLYLDDEENAAVAAAVCRMWRSVLGITVTPRGMSRDALTEALHSGNYTIAALTVEPLSGDAEAFLMPWTSDNADNVLHYENSAYDTLMAIIAGAEDATARMGCLHDAEDLLIGMDCALAPLYHRAFAWELRGDYAGAVLDPRGWFDLSGVTPRVQAAG